MASTNITTFPGKVGISNANPTHTLSIGSTVFVDDTGLTVLGEISTTGTLSGDGAGLSNIQTSNVIGLTDNVARIGTLETDLSDNSSRISTVSTDLSDNSSRISTVSTDLSDNSSRISTVSTDLSDNSSRISTVSTDLSDNSSRISTVSTDLSDNSSRISTISTDLSDNSSRISTVSTDLSDNSSRITSLESGASSISGVKTFQDDIILESNLRVNGSLTYANTVNMIVSDPIIELGANNQHTNDLGLVLTRHGNLGNDSNVAIFYDESQDTLKIGYTDNSASETTLTTTATGLDVSITGNVAAAYDTDETSYFGRAAVGYMGQSDQASFSHLDKNTSANFALKQAASGATHINTPTGQHIRFSVNASEVGRFTGGGDFEVGTSASTKKLIVDTSASEVQMYSQATGSTAGPDLVLMRNNPNNGANNEYIGQIRYEGLSDTGNSRLYAKTTGKIKTATNGSEDGVIETMIKTGGSNRISVRHSGAKFLIQKGTDLQVGEVANLYVDTSTSRVGIGMSNPSYTLDVDGDINLSTGSTLRINGTPAVFSNWTVSGSDIYRPSGNVGIGTTSPIAALDINGGAENNTTPALSIRGGSYDPSDLYVLNTYNTNTGVGYAAKVIGVNIKNKVETDNTVQIRNNVGGITSAGAIYLGSDDVNQGIFGVLGGTGTVGSTLAEYLTVKGNGNVGIGLTGPESKLHIYGSDNPLMLQSQRSPYPKLSYDFSGSNAENLQFYDHHGSGRGFLYGRKYTTGTNANPYAGWHFYGNDNTVALRIDGSANVGIGTTSPKAVTHVGKLSANSGTFNDIPQSNMGISATFPDSTRLWLANRVSATGEDYWGMALGTKYTGDIYIQSVNKNSTAVYDLLLQPNGGNVGIGTASPGYKLHVNGSSMFTSTMNLTTSSGYAAFEMGGPSGAYIDLKKPASDDYDLRIITTGTGGSIQVGAAGDVMNFDGSGNVGIGTSSPGAKLDVNGYIAHNNPVFYAHNFGNGGGGTTSSNYIVYRNTEVNVGSNFSTSTGIFTCPRNGVYKFTWGAIANNSDTVYRYYIRINNANIINGTHNRIDNTANGSNFGNGTSSIILTLSTNDTVRIFYIADNGSTSSYGYNYDIFMGYMISA